MGIPAQLDILVSKIMSGEVKLDGRIFWVSEIYTYVLEQRSYDPTLRISIEKTVKPLVEPKIEGKEVEDEF